MENDEQLDHLLEDTLREKDVRKFRAAAQKASEAHKAAAPPRQGLSNIFLLGSIAASLVLAAGVTFFWLRPDTAPQDPQQLAESLLTEYDSGIAPLDPGITRDSGASPGETQLQLQMAWMQLDSLYRSGNYESALQHLGQVTRIDPAFAIVSRAEWNFYTGMCLLRMGQTEQALQWLQQVQSPFLEKANFFTAIALIRLGRTDEALVYLRTIDARPSHPYKEPARQLWKAIE